MPELPEVETTRNGISPLILGQRVIHVEIHNNNLRRKVSSRLRTDLPGQEIIRVDRRGKYLLLITKAGTVIVHLGMSGHISVVSTDQPLAKHDHVDIIFNNGRCLRFHDPRRFGLVLWTKRDPCRHELLKALGPEPLINGFDGNYLYNCSRGRHTAVKNFIMDSRIVAGVGNIYASEALYLAKIHPRRPVNRIAKERYQVLADSIRQVLRQAIAAGGTTLRDFLSASGKPGYFQQSLLVYNRAGQACVVCDKLIKVCRLGQRSSYYCPYCQR